MKALWFVIMFLIIQQLEGNLIYPKVVGNSVGLPSLWVLVAVTLGSSMFGVVGMLMFIPLFSTAYTLIKEDVNKSFTRVKSWTKGDNQYKVDFSSLRLNATFKCEVKQIINGVATLLGTTSIKL
jgi:predicted PurR-regulated permease PerM